MEELKLKLHHDLPFEGLSMLFPDMKIFRWCNSYTDYLEVYGENIDNKKLKDSVDQYAETLNSKVISYIHDTHRIAIILSCRCTIENSTLRMAESMGCMIRPPVIYENACEFLHILCVEDDQTGPLLDKFFGLGDLEVVSKKKVVENDLRSLWVMQMSEIFSDLTERQMRYFSDALTAGYFEIPKRVKIDQLARMNNLSMATMQEHLSKAESKILTSLDNYLKFYHRYMEKSP